MRHGVFLPPFDDLSDPVRMGALAAAAEGAGWDGFFLWDHLLYSAPVVRIADPWISLAVVAQETATLRIGPMVTPIARRRPAMVARQAVTLDVLARGRMILGLGLGDDGAGEFDRFKDETTRRARGRMLDEGAALVRSLVSGAEVNHVGPAYSASGVQLLPPSPQPGGFPIWLGARWPNRAPLRRAARYDGVIAIQLQQPDDVVALRAEVAAAGADMGRFDVAVVGGPGQDLREWQEAGVTWWLTQFGPYGIDVDAARRAIEAGPPPHS